MLTSLGVPPLRRIYLAPLVGFSADVSLVSGSTDALNARGLTVFPLADGAMSRIIDGNVEVVATNIGLFVPTQDWVIRTNIESTLFLAQRILDVLAISNDAIIRPMTLAARRDLWVF